ncbi:MAG: hypothetical protein QM771_15125 [Nitrospira sp.]
MKYVLLIVSIGLGMIPQAWHHAHASLVTYQFSGTLTDVPASLHTTGEKGANGFETGLKVTGAMTFNTSTPGVLTPPPPGPPFGFQLYNYASAITSLTPSVGTYTPTVIGNGSISVLTGSRAGYGFSGLMTGNLVDGQSPSFFSLQLVGETGTALSSITLPGAAPPELAAFIVRRWGLAFGNGDTLTGSLDSLTAVPLPSTGLLLGGALLVLAGFMRANRSHGLRLSRQTEHQS